MEDISLSDKPERISNVEEEELEDELLVYQPSTEKIHNLNATASFIWSLSNGSRSLNFFVEEIKNSTDVDEEQVQSDVINCVEKLREEKLIQLN